MEFAAVAAQLSAVEPGRGRDGDFEFGWLNGTGIRVALAEIGEGNHGSAAWTQRAIDRFHPELVAFIGVAGALEPGLELGDVVVARHVYAYHGGKDENGVFNARPRSWPVREALVQTARSLRRSRDWSGRPAVHIKPIAAGEVVLNSSDSPLRDQIIHHYNDACAIEMEGAGVAQAAHLNEATPMLIVRGISDKADGRKYDADGAGWQPKAAANAAAFGIAVIRHYLSAAERPSVQSPPLARAAESPIERTDDEWRSGSIVAIGDEKYLLSDEYLEERRSTDGSVRERSALGRRLADGVSLAERYCWLRDVTTSADTAEAGTALRALSGEVALLTRLGERARVHAGTITAPGSASLVLTWPTSRSSDEPSRTWADLPFGELDRWRIDAVLVGLVGVADVLARLHAVKASHRRLTAAGLIRLDNNGVCLRDLGLAARPPGPGEDGGPYRAPEQQRRRPGGQPGPSTDVYQLAALGYTAITGDVPAQYPPLPLRAYGKTGPDAVLRRALAPSAADRPSMKEFAAELRGA